MKIAIMLTMALTACLPLPPAPVHGGNTYLCSCGWQCGDGALRVLDVGDVCMDAVDVPEYEADLRDYITGGLDAGCVAAVDCRCTWERGSCWINP